ALVRRLIGILDRLGDRAAALEAYRDLAKRLTAVYDVQPSPETEALVRAVRTRALPAAAETLPRAVGATVRDAEHGEGRRPWLRRRASVALALCVVVAASVMAASYRGRRASPTAGASIRSVAILPFDSPASDTALGTVANTMTEALSTDIGLIKALRVTSPRATADYRRTTKAMRTIARELGVEAVVEADVHHSGDQLRVDVRLVDAAA